MPQRDSLFYFIGEKCGLARISQQLSTAAADPGMSTALRSVGLLDRLSSLPPRPSVARLVSTPVCTASRRNLVRSAGLKSIAGETFDSPGSFESASVQFFQHRAS